MNEIKELVDQIDMESYFDREGIQYRVSNGSRGLQLNVKTCPKCGGNKWKVFIGAETGFGNCFSGSCEAKFNKWSFIEAYLGLPKAQIFDHIKQVAGEMGWRPPRKAAAVKISTSALKMPPSFAIPVRGKNLKYLENRGVTTDIAQFFNLRLSLTGKYWYEMEGRKCAQDYSNRIIVPIFDLDGGLVSFQGRDITGKAEKKYLFPPGFAATGKYLYNGQNCVGLETVVMGEGAFDVIAIRKALDTDHDLRGIGALGSFGKNLSYGDGETQLSQFLKLKASGLKTVVVMWDGELGAIDGAVEAGKMLKSYGLKVKIALLPPGKDPNEIDAEMLKKKFYQAIPLEGSAAMRILTETRRGNYI